MVMMSPKLVNLTLQIQKSASSATLSIALNALKLIKQRLLKFSLGSMAQKQDFIGTVNYASLDS